MFRTNDVEKEFRSDIKYFAKKLFKYREERSPLEGQVSELLRESVTNFLEFLKDVKDVKS